MSRQTGLRARLQHGSGFRSYNDLTRPILSAVREKTKQCSGLDAACLLAVGTFHFEASGLCHDEMHLQHVLTSTTGISMAFDPETGKTVGEMTATTDLQASSVLRAGTSALVEPARRPISGLLVCGFGCEVLGESWPVKGVLHPDPVRPFPRELLPGIRFCELERGYEQGQIKVSWT